MDGQGQEAGDGQEAAVTAVGEWARAWCRAMPEAARQEYIDRALHSLLPGVPVGEYRPGRRFAFGPDKTSLGQPVPPLRMMGSVSIGVRAVGPIGEALGEGDNEQDG